MDEAIIFPSPNWFLSNGIAVNKDGWFAYGGPSKSLCLLEPLPTGSGVVHGNQGFRAHIHNRAHLEKITCVDFSPDWPEKKCVIAGSADGAVKQWSLETVQNTSYFKVTQSHDVHSQERGDVVGLGYMQDNYAVSVSSYSTIVKWDLNTNITKYLWGQKMLKGFKPSCVACSQHLHMHVAIGTKQGVVFVIDISGAGRIVYKIRGQDDEIIKMSFCPQYEVLVRKDLTETLKKSMATEKMERLRQEPITDEENKALDERVRKSMQLTEQEIRDEEFLDADDGLGSPSKEGNESNLNENETPQSSKQTKIREVLDESGIGKTLPEDSFDETIVEVDDMFDIYQEPDIEEFGHKKFQPQNVLVKIKEEAKQEDYLVECMRLKNEILKRKDEPESSMEALVNALDHTHVGDSKGGALDGTGVSPEDRSGDTVQTSDGVTSAHIHKHLLVTIGKFGSLRVWSKSGKLVGSCSVLNAGTAHKNQNQKNTKVTSWTTVLWYKPNVLLVGDGKNQLLIVDPLKIDIKNKYEWKVVQTLHKRGMFNIVSNVPRIQTAETPQEPWPIWTAGIDRQIIQYSLETRKVEAKYETAGGYMYMIQTCPYDAKKIAVSMGDGAVRVWEADLSDDETKLSFGQVTSYWQNVQGKVLTVAWHPTRENCLAFGTGESRVGLIETSGKFEKPAKTLQPAVNGGVYSLCWGEDHDLYAAAGGDLVVYKANKPEEAATQIPVEFESQKWKICAVHWFPQAMIVGSDTGAIAALQNTAPYALVTATFVFSKIIHSIDWHPQETTIGSEESLYKNLIAISSNDKNNAIVIVEYGDIDGSKKFSTWKTLTGHTAAVLEVVWSPHRDELLLSTSQDATVRVWNVEEGSCVSIFGGHFQSALCASWCSFPQLATKIVSGGSDACLRLWDMEDHPAEAFVDTASLTQEKKNKKKKKKETAEKQKLENEARKDEEEFDSEESKATAALNKIKVSKKFILPIIEHQIGRCKITAVKKMLQKYKEKNGLVQENAETPASTEPEYDLDFLKIFGTINEVNEVLDMEMDYHQDTGHLTSWMMLSLFRGEIDATIQFAVKRNILCPFLVSISPCVSFKYWKDVIQMYMAQIDRQVARGDDSRQIEEKEFGGPVYRKAAAQLAVHDVKGAVNTLLSAGLVKEAYILCRVRHLDSIATETLQHWADTRVAEGSRLIASICYMALDNFSKASMVLSKSEDEEFLSVAAEIAKIAGCATYADHLEQKKQQIQENKVDEPAETKQVLEALPSRVETFLKKVHKDNQDDQNGKAITVKESLDRDKSEESLQELHTKMQNVTIETRIESVQEITNETKTGPSDNTLEEKEQMKDI